MNALFEAAKEVCDFLKARRWNFCVIGGLAVQRWGESRATLDALVAHLYGLTEEEFAYILTTFPLVEESVKQQTLNTFRDMLRLGKLPEVGL